MERGINNKLRIGDLILLKQIKINEGWLSADGIIDIDCNLSSETILEDCLWQITVQNQYSASTELEHALLAIENENNIKNMNNNGNNYNNNNIDNSYNSYNFSNQINNNNDNNNNNNKNHNNSNNLLEKDSRLIQLTRTAENEQRLNKKLMAMKIGKPISFGDVIQLLHIKSQKFLTVSPFLLAKYERENLRVYMKEYGDSMSWLELMPRFKYDKEGQSIVNGNECLIRVHERSTDYIHASRKSFRSLNGDERPEINCSLESSVWSIIIYQSTINIKSNSILCGQLITLHEPETLTYLQLQSTRDMINHLDLYHDENNYDEHHNLETKDNNSNNNNNNNNNNNEQIIISPRVIMSDSIQISLTSQIVENVGTQFLWQLESTDLYTGGVVYNSIGKYLLKDLNRGLYLKLESNGIIGVKNRNHATGFEMVVPYQLNYGDIIQDDTLVQLVSDKLSIGVRKNSIGILEVCSCPMHDRMTLSFQISSKLHKQLSYQVFVGKESKKVLQQFNSNLVKTLKILNREGVNSFNINIITDESITSLFTEIEHNIKEIIICLDHLKSYLQYDDDEQTIKKDTNSHDDDNDSNSNNNNSSNSSNSNNINNRLSTTDSTQNFKDIEKKQLENVIINQKEKIITLRQIMLREQGVLDVLLDIVDMLGNQEEETNNVTYTGLVKHSYTLNSNNPKQTPETILKKKSKIFNNQRGRSSIGDEVSSVDRDLCRLCLHVLFLSINNNQGNQIYVADKFTTLLNQVKYHEYAVTCVQEMLRDNRQMLQTKISDRDIKKFLELLRESPMNVVLLRLLRSTCSCPTGVDNTQRMVAAALFRLKDDDLARSLSRASQLIRMLTKGDGDIPSLLLPQRSQLPSPIIPLSSSPPSSQLQLQSPNIAFQQSGRLDRKRLTWSESSPLTGFDLQQRARELQELNSFSNLIIKVSLSSKDYTQKIVLPEFSVYLPKEEQDLQNVLGLKVFQNGLSTIYVSWPNQYEEEYNMNVLYGIEGEIKLYDVIHTSKNKQLQVQSPTIQTNQNITQTNSNIPQVIQPASTPNRKTVVKKQRRSSVSMLQNTGPRNKRKSLYTGKSKTVAERRAQVIEYLVAQLYLAADLCLDRNYVAIGLLEETYSIGLLYTMLKTPTLPNRIKAPVCKLVRTLYLDREPQIASKFPRLVRTSISLTGGVEDSFSNHHSGNPYTFAILQQIISDYLRNEFNSKKCDELSSEMMELLHSLIKFGFYHSSEQLKDIITPLVQSLAIHQLDDELINGKKDISRRGSVIALISKQKILSEEPIKSPESENQNNQQNNEIKTSPDLLNSETNIKTSIQNNLKRFKSKQPRKKKLTWQAQLLVILESIRALLFVLTLVVLISIYFLVHMIADWKEDPIFYDIDFAISMIFISEILIRMYCYGVVNKNISTFFSSWFHIIDFSVMLIDVFLICLNSQLSTSKHFTHSLPVIRGLRLIRVFRAARLLKKIADKTISHEKWIAPSRYNKATIDEVRTIAGILRVLSETYDIIHDRKLTSCIKAFIEWNESDSNPFSLTQSILKSTNINTNFKTNFKTNNNNNNGNNNNVNHHRIKLALDSFHKHLQSDEELSNLFPKKFDTILTDIVMYSDPILVKEALKVLLLYKNHEEILLYSMKNVQLLYTPKMELTYTTMMNSLKQLQRIAEAYEVWCDLKNEEEISVATTTENLLLTILQYIKVIPMTKEFDLTPTCYVNIEVQQILTNIDMITTIMTLQKALLDMNIGFEPPNLIKNIIIVCNKLITEYVRNNEINQNIVYQYQQWFLDRIDDGMRSSKVIRNVLSRNHYLIKQCQRKYLAEIMQKIISNGRKPEYLDFFIGLTDTPDIEDSSIAYLHNEITRYITHSERSSDILLWCCSPLSEEYQERINEMEPYINSICSEEELSSNLQYHINLLTLLASCRLGPKIQAIYPFDDIISAIIDPKTIWHIRVPLTYLLFEVVNSSIEGLEASESIWKFFEYYELSLKLTMTELNQLLTRTELFNKLEYRQRWISAGLYIIQRFFKNFNFELFFELISFQNDDTLLKLTKRSEDEIKLLTSKLFLTLQEFRDKSNKLLSKFTKKLIHETLLSWRGFGDDPVSESLSNNFIIKDKRKSLTSMRRASVQAEVQQVLYRQQYTIFTDIIFTSYKQSDNIKIESLELFERLPSIHDSNINADVRLEPFIFKLTTYLRNSIRKTNTSRFIDISASNTASWILSTMRKIIEKNMNINLELITKPKYDLSSSISNLLPFHDIINEYGVTKLCIELISVGIQQNLVNEAIKLLVILLSYSDGNILSQKTIYNYLISTDSTLFFEEIRDLLEHLRSWSQKEDENFDNESIININQNNTIQSTTLILPFSTSSSNLLLNERIIVLPDSIYVLSLIKHMTLGNYEPNQLIFKEQEGNSRHINILDYLSSLIDMLSRMSRLLSCDLLIRVEDVVLSLIKGPCSECQEYFILHTELLIALNRILKLSLLSIHSKLYEYNLMLAKEYAIDIIRGSIEGISISNLVIDKVQSTIEFNILNEIILPTKVDEFGVILEDRVLNKLQTKYLVLLQTLNNNINSYDLSPYILNKMKKEIGCVEIVWNQTLYKHYFHIPLSAQNLSQNSKSKLLHNIEFMTQEKKLTDFIKKSRELHREGIHQERLKSYGFIHVWNIKVILTYIMFINICVMNVLLTFHYILKKHHNEHNYSSSSSPSSSFLSNNSILSSSLSETEIKSKNEGIETIIDEDYFDNINDNSNNNYNNNHNNNINNILINTLNQINILSSSFSSTSSTLSTLSTGSTTDSTTISSSPSAIYLPEEIQNKISNLTLFHLILISLTLLIIFIVRVPLSISSSRDLNRSYFVSILFAIFSPLTFWYIIHFIITWIAYTSHPLYLTVLILEYLAIDIKTNEILLTVINPWRFMITTLTLFLIFLYIFSVFVFIYYRNNYTELDCYTLYDSFKIMLSYGFRAEEGIASIMDNKINIRIIFDILFYFVIAVILRNVLFGIIIDNNAELRGIIIEREHILNNYCFICGINQQSYNKRTNYSFNFKLHQNVTHNLWNYLYFIIKILSQNMNEDSNIETYIRKLLKYNDISWFPIGFIGIDEDIENTNQINNNGNNNNNNNNNNLDNILNNLKNSLNINETNLNGNHNNGYSYNYGNGNNNDNNHNHNDNNNNNNKNVKKSSKEKNILILNENIQKQLDILYEKTTGNNVNNSHGINSTNEINEMNGVISNINSGNNTSGENSTVIIQSNQNYNHIHNNNNNNNNNNSTPINKELIEKYIEKEMESFISVLQESEESAKRLLENILRLPEKRVIRLKKNNSNLMKKRNAS